MQDTSQQEKQLQDKEHNNSSGSNQKKTKRNLKSEMRPERCIPTDRKITQHAQIP